jgi:tetratricopeptide (TPR) repeat protein
MNSFYDNFFGKKHWTYLVLILTPFFLYRKSLSFDFSPLDEQWIIEDNAWFLKDWSNLKAIFTGSTALMIYYRPFLAVSTMIDFHIGKLDPFVYHLNTLIWHLGCTLLLFEFLLQYQASKRTAFLLALIFAVHPMMIHTVAWIPGRNDSMLCFFMLASIISLNSYIDRKKIRLFLFHILFFMCALLTKETAIVFPLIYFVIIYLRQKENKKLLWASASLWLVLLCGWVILWKNFVSVSGFTDSDVMTTAKNATAACFLYLGKTIFPFQQSVAPVLKHTSVVPGIFTLLALVFLWWRFKPEDKKAAFLGCFLFIALLIVPVIFIAMKENGEYYEHRLYAPMTGVFLFISRLKLNIKSPAVTVVFICITGFLMLLTHHRMNAYKDKLSFLNAAIRSYPEYYFFYLRQGQILDKQGDYENAIQSFNQTIERSPGCDQAYLDRGNAYFSLSDKKHALADYTSALAQARPVLKEKILMQRCIAYNIYNEPELAMNDLQTLKTIYQRKIGPDFEKELTKKLEIGRWNRKVSASPRNAELYLMRGLFFIEQLMAKEALADLKKATELAPGNREYLELFKRASVDLAPAAAKMK